MWLSATIVETPAVEVSAEWVLPTWVVVSTVVPAVPLVPTTTSAYPSASRSPTARALAPATAMAEPESAKPSQPLLSAPRLRSSWRLPALVSSSTMSSQPSPSRSASATWLPAMVAFGVLPDAGAVKATVSGVPGATGVALPSSTS